MNHPGLAEKFNNARQAFGHYQTSASKQRSRGLITIPVVVHVVHDGDTVGGNENISDAQIISQIEALNRDFRNLNPGLSSVPAVFRSLAADFEIEFCLASRDPDGNPTSGIERINGGRATWDKTLADQLKPSTIWNPSQYLNIWTMRLGGANASTLGYAQFPGMPDSTDGVVIDYTAFGTTGSVHPSFSRGKTTTHEIGHWLGLFHIWGDDQGACSLDDGIADTPLQASENFGCPSFPHVSCNNGPDGDMFMNFMDYTDDHCSGMFTIGQKALADFTLTTSRLAIRSSHGCVSTTVNERDMAVTGLLFPTAQICTDRFTPIIQVRNHGSATITSMLVNYQVDGAGLRQFHWHGNIPTYALDYVTLPEMTLPAGLHSLYIYLSAPNGGADQYPGNEDASINFNIADTGSGAPIPAAEHFESGALPAAWQLQNPDGDRSWLFDASSGTAWFDNFSGTASNNPRGKRDGLITPEFDFHTSEYPYISFRLAYARKSDASKDSLIVYYSPDCGYSWWRIFAKGSAALATAADRPAAFIPQAGEWREERIPVYMLANQSKIKFRLENYSDFGNNIYVDDFKVNLSAVGTGSMPPDGMRLNVFPNPNEGRFYMTLNITVAEDVRIELFNANGQKVRELWENRMRTIPLEVDLSGFPKGLYVARVTASDFYFCKKILIDK